MARDDDGDATPAPDTGAPDPDAGDQPTTARRPSPAASAASRARRIGGSTRPRAGLDSDTEARIDDAVARAKPPARKPGRPAPPSAPPAAAAAVKGRAASAKGTAAAVKDRPADAATDDGSGPGSGGPAWLAWAPAAILAAGAIAMVVVITLVAHGVWWGKDTASQKSTSALREQVTAAAKTCLAATNTYKYTDLDKFERAGTACTTGAQTTQFRKAVDTLIRKNAPKLKFTQTAQINKAAVESVSGGQWTILLFGQLQVTNASTPSGRTDPFAALVRMQKVKGKWLISSLQTVSSPVN